jgi:hypothetical protein
MGQPLSHATIRRQPMTPDEFVFTTEADASDAR